jgi:hypothetical protein
MSRPTAPFVLAALLLAILAAGCRDEETATPPKPAETPPAPKPEPDPLANAERVLEEAKKKFDRDARGLLASFDARTYDPRRDGRLSRAAGTLLVKAGGKEATYRFAYDAANPAEKPVTTDPVSEPEGWDPELTRHARAWAVQACVGPFPVVAFYRPPVQLALVPSIDKKNLVVTAPPFRGPLSVSYSFDDRQLVTIRGEWTDEQHRTVTRYEWDLFHGRYMLRRETIHEGAVADFEYDDSRGLPLLRKVRRTNGGEVVTAEFSFETVERRPE